MSPEVHFRVSGFADRSSPKPLLQILKGLVSPPHYCSNVTSSAIPTLLHFCHFVLYCPHSISHSLRTVHLPKHWGRQRCCAVMVHPLSLGQCQQVAGPQQTLVTYRHRRSILCTCARMHLTIYPHWALLLSSSAHFLIWVSELFHFPL